MLRRFLERRRAARRLARLDLFRGCTPHQLASIDRLITEVHVPAGRVLIEEGAAGFEFMIVTAGRAEVVRGNERLAIAEPGSFVGEMALIEPGRRSATVRALDAMRVFALNPAEFSRLLEIAPLARDRILRAAGERRLLASAV